MAVGVTYGYNAAVEMVIEMFLVDKVGAFDGVAGGVDGVFEPVVGQFFIHFVLFVVAAAVRVVQRGVECPIWRKLV